MFSRPTLGINTAVYGNIPLIDAIAQADELNIDGVLLAWRPDLPPVELGELKLFGLAYEGYQLGQDGNVWTLVLETAVSRQAPAIVIPVPARTEPFGQTEAEQFVAECQTMAQQCASHEIDLVVELSNRFYTNMLTTIAQAERFLAQTAQPNIKLSLSTFDMNIEEQDGAGLLRQLEPHLAFLRMSDSNHGAIGEGHIKLGAYLWAIQDMTRDVPILLEVERPYSSPFTPNASTDAIQTLLQKSRSWF